MAQEAWAVITGASAGIGEAFARQLAGQGYSLVLAARRRQRLEALAASLRGHVQVVSTDLAEPAGREQLWRVVQDLPGQAKVLINNAGFGLRGEFAGLSRARQLEMIAINAAAVVDLTHRYLELRREGGGVLINVASAAGFTPLPGFAVYAASKSLVVSFSLAVAEEARLQGVQLLALCPGPVPTEFQQIAGSAPSLWSKLVAISADQVASEGLSAAERGETIWVPGRAMRAAVSAFRILPAGASAWLTTSGRGKRAEG